MPTRRAGFLPNTSSNSTLQTTRPADVRQRRERLGEIRAPTLVTAATT
jgi:hypothetical protein